ncbi:phage shock protein operon transcriptional activator [Xenorhabdus sp. 42]|uniref:phage shock protein operon transcriptional activator n=1 Tax=Xenorhabdus szentirmaii TaxID=290112 RepID=UPI0019BEE106|nr:MULTISPECIES: phage shock protein operon transcriptional activator [unclassified Xenorhabdus]MBD2793359.1 phage shock protein operon transcriptional activator [Xenorhabdus sp. CUL]MBD2804602.1 phage shock protein operon transcriptional activator [Xenorhabdus sp. ZM]MBD2819633.1 phage shock protein operon transcriptional activator [Xenorhabdus sp. 42]MBD2825829.1 phage shock protein operon transcriptional activator [Xenorhabdus sp. 5]
MSEFIDNLLGEANCFIEILEQVSALAKLNKPVLVLGERGTGKELIARRLHYLSPRWQGPFISLNCAALNENLLDSELFGHEAGAFTGARAKHQGRFERADGGTLFLDELATAPMQVQEKLLRVIEYGHLERVGGTQSLQVNVRLICATNEDLPAMAARGKFRADLLDRLAFDVVQIPPLRQRQQDIMLLAQNFAIQMCRELNLPFFPGFAKEAKQQLLSYHWPGNVRELKNVIERSIYRHGDDANELKTVIINPFLPSQTLLSASLPVCSAQDGVSECPLPELPLDLRQWQSDSEKRLIMQALAESHFNQRKAANKLSLTYHQLRGLIKKHHIDIHIN